MASRNAPFATDGAAQSFSCSLSPSRGVCGEGARAASALRGHVRAWPASALADQHLPAPPCSLSVPQTASSATSLTNRRHTRPLLAMTRWARGSRWSSRRWRVQVRAREADERKRLVGVRRVAALRAPSPAHRQPTHGYACFISPPPPRALAPCAPPTRVRRRSGVFSNEQTPFRMFCGARAAR